MKKREQKILVRVVFLFLIFFSGISFLSAAELRVTEEHPFLVDGEWITASQLQVGDELTTIDGGKVRITGIEDIVENVTVYNLHVNGVENYFANGVLVHNKAMEAGSLNTGNSILDDLEIIEIDAGEGFVVLKNKNDQYFIEDLTPTLLDSLPQSKISSVWMDVSKVSKAADVLYKPSKEVFDLTRPIHGTSSQALPGIFKEGKLTNLQTMLDHGNPPFSGELIYGGSSSRGINRVGISFMDANNAKRFHVTNYIQNQPLPWSMDIGRNNIRKLTIRSLNNQIIGAPNAGRFQLKMEYARIKKWGFLTDSEKEIIENPFRVVLEIKAPKIEELRKVYGSKGELVNLEDIPLDNLIFYVPEEKIASVQALFSSSIDIRPLSSLKLKITGE